MDVIFFWESNRPGARSLLLRMGSYLAVAYMLRSSDLSEEQSSESLALRHPDFSLWMSRDSEIQEGWMLRDIFWPDKKSTTKNSQANPIFLRPPWSKKVVFFFFMRSSGKLQSLSFLLLDSEKVRQSVDIPNESKWYYEANSRQRGSL